MKYLTAIVKFMTLPTMLIIVILSAQTVIFINTLRITRLSGDRWTGTDMKKWVEHLKENNPGLVVREPVHGGLKDE